MTYYQHNTDDMTAVLCDSCGAARWEQHPKYGTNTDARLRERDRTGIQWNWTNNYSTVPVECCECGGVA